DLNLIELLRNTTLADDVHVTPTDDSFAAAYDRFKNHISAELLKYPEEIKPHNRMPLRLYHALSDQGLLSLPPEKLLLYTAKGAATKICALIPVDADLLRLCGYYLAEGFISLDRGRAGAVRERVGFSFNEREVDYIVDVQRILHRWGLKYLERQSTHAISTIVS